MMAFRLRVHEDEPIGHAVRRLKRHISFHQSLEKWYRRGLAPRVYVKPCVIRGVKKFMKNVKARAGSRRVAYFGVWS